MPRIKRGDIKVNQRYLMRWDKYRLDWFNSEEYKTNPTKPLLLPITVDISGGVMRRSRIKVPELQTIMSHSNMLATNSDVKAAYDSYVEFFKAQDGSQSGTPPETPLDFNIDCCAVHLFYLKRDNWEFTDHTQFSVSNLNPAQFSEAFEVLDVFDDNRALLVKNNNWSPPGKKVFNAKYNLHVSIYQDVKTFDENDDVVEREVRTDIIIDPGSNTNQGSGAGEEGPP